MDRISDSGSDGCGSIPHGGTSFFIPAFFPAMSGILWASEKILFFFFAIANIFYTFAVAFTAEHKPPAQITIENYVGSRERH